MSATEFRRFSWWRYAVVCWFGWRCPRIWSSGPYVCGHCGAEYEPNIDLAGRPL